MSEISEARIAEIRARRSRTSAKLDQAMNSVAEGWQATMNRVRKDYETRALAAEAERDKLKAALEKAKQGLDAGIHQYAATTLSGAEIPGDEQYPWVRLMQVGRDAALAALAQGDHT